MHWDMKQQEIYQLEKHLERENLHNVILVPQEIFVLLNPQYDHLNHKGKSMKKRNF